MRLSLYEFETGVETIGGNRVVYDVAADRAYFGAATVDGHALVWHLEPDEDVENALLSAEVHLDPFEQWLVRCDRLEFPKGGVAPTHTHPGPGIRFVLTGEVEVRIENRSSYHGPGGAWFERGPDPVYVEASQHHDTTFVRVLVLPAEWAGKRTVRYADPAHHARPAVQQVSVYLEHPISLPG